MASAPLPDDSQALRAFAASLQAELAELCRRMGDAVIRRRSALACR